jgi:hypothetical protein
MTKIEARNIHGFDVDDDRIDHRCYSLPTSQMFLVGKKREGLEVNLISGDNHDEMDHDLFFDTLNFAMANNLDPIVAVDHQFNGIHRKDAEKKLVARLASYDDIVRPGFERFFDGQFDEPEYIQLLTQCVDPEFFDSFLESCLRITLFEAERSLEKNEPNFRIQTVPLVDDISKLLGRELSIHGIPPQIQGFTKYRFADQLSGLLNPGYVNAIVQPDGSSFTYDRAMQRQVARLTCGLHSDLEKSKAIFGWISSNVTYGSTVRSNDVRYRGALQVYKDREGVCGESAALQVTMERLAGNMAFLVEVGSKHAIASHIGSNGKVVLVDTTNKNGFDVKYSEFKIISDDHSLAGYD